MQLDLNADVGEGLPAVDAELVPLVSSVNVACGLHAGDAQTMASTIALARRYGVAVGAHPGFDDREGFGRRRRELPAEQVLQLIVFQLGALHSVAAAAGVALRHVKPHGALYNQAETDDQLAEAIVRAVRAFDPRLRLVGRAGSAMQRASIELDHPFTPEAFADRQYRPDGSLLPRSEPGAVLTDPEQVAGQLRSLVTHGEVTANDGSRVRIAFESLCLHGDTPGALELAARVRQDLKLLGVVVSAPRSPAVEPPAL